jgi:SAM-dependent methyltransferase
MGVTTARGEPAREAAENDRGEPVTCDEVVWHDLECGDYRADLPLWRALAERADPALGSAAILDVGAGTGRVALDLAGRGHRVTALDVRAELLGALAQRAGTNSIETVCTDARSFELARRDFDLCLVPMQTIQLLGGASARATFLDAARPHLRRGALLACAIVTELEPYDSGGDFGPSAETAVIGGRQYSSRATRVRVDRRRIVIERERRIRALEERAPGGQAGELNVVELDRISASALQREGVRAGFTAAGFREIPATEEHVGSVAVMLRA